MLRLGSRGSLQWERQEVPCCTSVCFRTPQITPLLRCGHLFSSYRGRITGQGQLNAVSEDFHASLCLDLGCDKQKEHRASCACRMGPAQPTPLFQSWGVGCDHPTTRTRARPGLRAT